LKLDGTHQLSVYADNVNIFGGSIHILKQVTTALTTDTKQIGREVNDEKTKYMFMPRGQNARQNNNIKTGNISFDRVA
jgi:hypothetical protein